MSLFDERHTSSRELPNPADVGGLIAMCFEPGVTQLCPWVASGGEAGAVWQPLADSYTGPLAGLPAANRVRAGARAWITDIGAVQEIGANVYTYRGGRLRSDGTTWRPVTEIPLWDVTGPDGSPVAVSGAGALANNSTSAMTPAAGNPTLPALLYVGAKLRTTIVAKRTAGTTNSLGLQVALALNGVPVFGVPFNASAATAENDGTGIATVTTTGQVSSQSLDLVNAQTLNGYANFAVAGVVGSPVALSFVRANASGGAVTDNLSLFIGRVTLLP